MVYNYASEVHKAQEWVKENIDIFLKVEDGVLEIEVGGVFDLGVSALYELLTHPDNSEIFRGVKRCIKRRILWNNGCMHQLVEVVNESNWNIAGILRGVAKTKLLVEQDEKRCLVHFVLASRESNPFKEMYGRWKIYPMESEKKSCLLTLYQRFKLRRLPPVILSTVGHFAKSQVRSMFEDLMVEIYRLNEGKSSLAPYSSQCMKEFGEESNEDPIEAMKTLHEMSQAHPPFPALSGNSIRHSYNGMPSIGRFSTAERMGKTLFKNSQLPPVSHPVGEVYCKACPLQDEIKDNKRQAKTVMRGTAYMLYWARNAVDYIDQLLDSDDEGQIGECFDDFPSPWFVIA